MRGRRHFVAVAFGKVLRELRHEAGLSQEELAAEAEIDRNLPIPSGTWDENTNTHEVLQDRKGSQG